MTHFSTLYYSAHFVCSLLLLYILTQTGQQECTATEKCYNMKEKDKPCLCVHISA